MSIPLHFPSLTNFLDPQSIKGKDGQVKPYAPSRFKEIIQERYWISKNINTSYIDTLKITPLERKYILEFISDEIQKTNKLIEDKKKQSKQK